VMGPSSNRSALGRPRIRLITDRTGQIYTQPKEIDLGSPASNKQAPRITGVIEPSKARFNVTSVLMAAGPAGPQA